MEILLFLIFISLTIMLTALYSLNHTRVKIQELKQTILDRQQKIDEVYVCFDTYPDMSPLCVGKIPHHIQQNLPFVNCNAQLVSSSVRAHMSRYYDMLKQGKAGLDYLAFGKAFYCIGNYPVAALFYHHAAQREDFKFTPEMARDFYDAFLKSVTDESTRNVAVPQYIQKLALEYDNTENDNNKPYYGSTQPRIRREL
ncbi:MAG: hypothetical protein ABSF18_02810 [Gammaproteobacteria bacterium]|jgi:hypothetical protein